MLECEFGGESRGEEVLRGEREMAAGGEEEFGLVPSDGPWKVGDLRVLAVKEGVGGANASPAPGMEWEEEEAEEGCVKVWKRSSGCPSFGTLGGLFCGMRCASSYVLAVLSRWCVFFISSNGSLS